MHSCYRGVEPALAAVAGPRGGRQAATFKLACITEGADARQVKSGETSRIADTDAAVRSLAGLAREAASRLRLSLGPGPGVPALRGDDAAVDEDVVAGDK